LSQEEPQEPILHDCPHCGGAHYSGQVCPLNPMLAELDRLELLSDEAAEAMESTQSEKEALAQWQKLKAAQLAQQDLHKQLESMGYRVLIDAEHPPFRHSASRNR